MPSQFGGIAVETPVTGSRFGGIPVGAAPAPVPAARRDSAMDAISGFLQGALADTASGVADSVQHPLKALLGVWERSKDQYEKAVAAAGPAGDNKGDLAGFLQHTAGMLPVLGPMASDFIDGIDANADAHDQARKLGQVMALKGSAYLTGKALEAGKAAGLGTALKAGAKAAAPDVLAGGAKAATGAAIAEMLPGDGVGKYIVGAVPIGGGVKQIGQGLGKGFDAARASLAERAAANAAAEIVPPPPAAARVPLWQKIKALEEHGQEEPAGPGQAPVATPVALPSAGPVRHEGPGLIPGQADRSGYATGQAREPFPQISDAQRAEDAAHEHAAYLQMQGENIIWANRTAKADRFARYLTKNKLEPTPENLADAARAMGERAAPSDETVPMIHDRMGYDPHAEDAPLKSRLADMLAPETDLERQLADSVAAAQRKAKSVKRVGDLRRLEK